MDGLRQMAGSKNVIELHGNIFTTRCSNPACDLKPYRDEQGHAGEVPHCPKCASDFRPDVVLFGEQIPALGTWAVKRALRDCDLFIAAGTSGWVAPAASYVRSAEYAGARTVLVNVKPRRPPNPAFREQHIGPAEEMLPRLLSGA